MGETKPTDTLEAPRLGRPMNVFWRLGFWDQRTGAEARNKGTEGARDRAYVKGWIDAQSWPGQYVPECWTEAQLKLIAYDLAIASLDAMLALPHIVRSPRQDNQMITLQIALERLRDKA